MDHRARIAAAAAVVTISLFHVTTASAEDKFDADPCGQLAVAPSRSDVEMSKTIGGIVFEEKVLSPAGVQQSEVTGYSLLDATDTPVSFTKSDAGRPGWVILAPEGGLALGSYTVSAKVACSDGTTADRKATVKVGADAPLPTAIGTVRIGDSFVAAPANGAKKSFDAVVVWVKPTPELEKHLGVAAWRVTAVAPDGTRHASHWLDYGAGALGAGQTEVRLSASAFCPANGAQKIEVEAAVPGGETLMTTSSWDVGELVCDSSPAGGGAGSAAQGTSDGSSSSCALGSGRSEIGGGSLVFAALGLVAVARRRSARAREA